MNTKPQTLLEQDIQEILAIAKRKLALQQKNVKPEEPEERDEQQELPVYALVANGCGMHGHEDGFICPVLLAA